METRCFQQPVRDAGIHHGSIPTTAVPTQLRSVVNQSAMLELTRTLQNKSIVLASASPRRRELLGQIGLRFKVIPSTFEENLDKNLPAAQYAQETALHKARQVYKSLLSAGERVPDMVIGADTVVERDGIILEKPEDNLDAAATLRSLRGKTHQVHTGVAIIDSSADECSFTETTVVSFMDFSDQDIDEYIASGEPFGKAGSYGIQGKAAAFVKGIEGCYFNVVGFPLHRFLRELDQFMSNA